MSSAAVRPLWDSGWRWLALFVMFGSIGLLWAAHPVLEVEQSAVGGHAQVFYSADEVWQEMDSSRISLLPGTRIVRLKLPLFLPKRLRYDPVDQAGAFHLHRVSLRYLLFSSEVQPATVAPLVASVGVGEATPSGDLEYIARDADPQLAIRVPTFAAVWFAIPVATTVLGFWLVCTVCWPRLRSRGRTLAVSILFLATCYATLVYQAIAMGPWLPVLDDWRYLYPGAFSLVDGSTHWLTIAGNDTYFLTGQLLDWTLLNLTSGDFLAMRLLALALLGVFLALTSRLAIQWVGATAALALGMLSFTVTGVAYWNLQALAYHQFLPVMFLFMVLALLHLQTSRPSVSRLVLLGLLLCTALAGLAYISGTVLLLAFAIGYLIGQRPRNSGKRLRAVAAPLLIAFVALATLMIQLLLVSERQGSLLERNHATATVYPSDPRFWAFQVGLVARALGATGHIAWLDISLYAAVILAGVLLLWRSRQVLADSERFSISICLGLLAAAFVYACVVASGRAGFASPDTPWVQVVAIAKSRFHFWWITALLAIPLAKVVQLALRQRRWEVALVRTGVAVLMAGKLFAIYSIDVSAYRSAALRETSAIDCVRASVAVDNVFASPILCDGFYPADLRAPLQVARDQNLMPWRRIMQEP